MPAAVALPESGSVTVSIAVTCAKCESDRFTVARGEPLTCAACGAESDAEPVSPAFAARFTLAGPDSESEAYAAAFPHARGRPSA